MSCYHPIAGIFHGEYNDNGKKIIHLDGHYTPDIENVWPGSVMIPCGKCIGCRLDYSRAWADRMILELETAGSGMFVTLTYDNEHIPENSSLKKRDVQLFMKRLRKKYPMKKIRFYCAGEYGSKTFRPHYHIILFGIGLSDLDDLRSHGVNEIGQAYYISDSFASVWSNGFILLSDVSWKTCAYTARYVTKKAFGNQSQLLEYLGKEPEFSLMSRKPGLAAEYLSRKPDILEYSNLNISTPEGGLKISIPKYYLEKLKVADTEKYDILKAERKKFAVDKSLLELSKTELGYVEYLEMMEEKKLKKIKSLKRK